MKNQKRKLKLKKQAVISSDEEEETFHVSDEGNEIQPEIHCEKENIVKKVTEINFKG